MTNLEINKAVRSIETIEDLKFQREEIIEAILTENEKANLSKVMTQMISIVSSRNWEQMAQDNDRDDLVYMAMNDVRVSELSPSNVIDNGVMNRENAINNLPSSMR